MSEKTRKQDRRTRYTQANHKRYVLRIVNAEKFYENYSYRNLQKC